MGGAQRKDLDEAGGGWFGGSHAGFMLLARGGIEVDGDAAGDDDGGVVDVIEIARDAKQEREGKEKDGEGQPTDGSS